ncbi:heme NO-binding domain-containing protein [Agaribacter flavus]|uniref:Heme NO-binding domain-containing protein n=1 Tax=Agaribacter flavus TaxID=1902781 RepID=A0ABV7FPE7_9ALTE
MQGAIFTAFSDLVIEQQGMGAWDEILDNVQPASGGIYTRGQQYDDNELFALVGALAEKTGLPATDLVRAFGKFLFGKLYSNMPPNIEHISDLKEFLISIDSVIHVEVQRIHPDAYLPKFEYTETPEGDLVMYYASKRKLCHAAEGLILGAAEQFQRKVTISHPECMHQGDERCKLIISIED